MSEMKCTIVGRRSGGGVGEWEEKEEEKKRGLGGGM